MRHVTFLIWLIGTANASHVIPGIWLALNQKGLDYFSQITSDVLQGILLDIRLPNPSAQTGASISNVRVTQMDRPNVTSAFVPDGIATVGVARRMGLTAEYETCSGWSSFFCGSKGKAKVTLTNVTLDALIDIDASVEGSPVASLVHCSIMVDTANITYTPDNDDLRSNFVGTLASLAVDVFKNYIGSGICTLLQELMVNASKRADQQSEESLMCGKDSLNIGRRPILTTSKPMFTVNMSLSKNPMYRKTQPGVIGRMVVHINGTTLYNNQVSSVSHPRLRYNYLSMHSGYKMLRIAISPAVANSFFRHLYVQGMGRIRERVHNSEYPSGIREIVGLVCPDCSIELRVKLHRPLTMQVSKTYGPMLFVRPQVIVYTYGYGQRQVLFGLDAYIKVLLRPYVNPNTNRLHASTSIVKLYVKPHQTQKSVLGEMLGITFGSALSDVNNQNRIWLNTLVDRQLRGLFGPQGGMPLPHVCGVSFRDTTMVPGTKNVLIIDSYFEYQSGPLIRRFRNAIAAAGAG